MRNLLAGSSSSERVSGARPQTTAEHVGSMGPVGEPPGRTICVWSVVRRCIQATGPVGASFAWRRVLDRPETAGLGHGHPQATWPEATALAAASVAHAGWGDEVYSMAEWRAVRSD